MASFGLEGPGLNSGQRGKRQTAGPSALGAPAAKRARRPERAGAFADGDAAPGAPPPRPRLGKTKVSRPAAGERRDFGLNLPATASRAFLVPNLGLDRGKHDSTESRRRGDDADQT